MSRWTRSGSAGGAWSPAGQKPPLGRTSPWSDNCQCAGSRSTESAAIAGGGTARMTQVECVDGNHAVVFREPRTVVQAARMTSTPAVIETAPSARTQVIRSCSTSAPSNMPNRMEVSRTAATAATGACVIAHKARV